MMPDNEHQRAENLLRDSNHVLEMLATGQPRQDVLKALNLMLETQVPGTRSSILILDETGRRFMAGSAPQLPDAYNDALFGVSIGPKVGSCGTAAYLDELVIVSDIAHDPLWEDFKDLALGHGLVACWSMPIHDSTGKVSGTFALYPETTCSPTDADLALIRSAVHIAGIVIEQGKAEQSMVQLNRTLRMISDCSQALVRIQDEPWLLKTICTLIVEEGGYRMAWVGAAVEDEKCSVTPLASAGFEKGYLKSVHISWADNDFGGGPSGQVLREGETIVCQNILHDPVFLPWRKEAIRRGYAASASFPLKSDKHIMGVLNIYASEQEAFNAGEIGLLEDLAGDMAFGLSVVRHRNDNALLEEQLRQAQKMEAVGILAGGIAHDFNNMLASMMGNIYLIRKKIKVDSAVQEKLEQVEKTGFHAAEMISQLLTFARKGVVHMQPLVLGSFLQETFAMLRSSVPENIDFTLDVSDTEYTVKGDPTLLQQVLLNIVINAKHAVAAQNNPIIHIALHVLTADEALWKRHPELLHKPCVCLSLEDNGCGIAKNDLNKLFEPFFTTKGVGEGTGLGLAMVYGAVQSHAGAIEVDSEQGKGSVFRLYLPLIEQAAATPITEDQEMPGHGESILLADDDEEVRTVTRQLLVSIGYHVLLAEDGEEAVSLFTKHQADIRLVMLDVVMPQLGGVDAATKMRILAPNLPVLFHTGYSEKGVLKEIKNMKNYRIVTKPVAISELTRILRGLLEAK